MEIQQKIQPEPVAMAETIRVLVMREGDMYVAQCLEYDIGAQAGDLDTLKCYVDVALDLEASESLARNGAPFAGIDPAPQRFHDLWEKRSRSMTGEHTVSVGDRDVQIDMALAA